MVQDIHQAGGTFLGTSRGRQDPVEMVDSLEHLGVDVLFVIGGDGTMTGARGIVEEVGRRGLAIAVMGLPKTIDNDLPFIDQSFGFLTAVARAADTVHAAHAEALSVRDGVSVVKLMGRHAGFVACYAAIAVNDVDLVLIPRCRSPGTGRTGCWLACGTAWSDGGGRWSSSPRAPGLSTATTARTSGPSCATASSTTSPPPVTSR